MNENIVNKLLMGGCIAGAALIWAGSDFSCLDSGRSKGDVAAPTHTIYEGSRKVDLGRIVGGEQLKNALSSTAQDLGWKISFRETYERGYKLGSVEETRKYRWTEVDVSTRQNHRLELTVYDSYYSFEGEAASLAVTSGPDEEVKTYLNRLSHHLKTE